MWPDAACLGAAQHSGELPPSPASTVPVHVLTTWQQPAAPTTTPTIWLLPQSSSSPSPAASSSPAPAVKATEAAPAATESKNKAKSKPASTALYDGDVKRWLEAADTKTKKALAWQYFASVLSQALGMVLNHDQVSLKYRKLKCIYRKEKREQKKTGNSARISEMDEGLWAILNDAFGGRVGISGDTLLDSAIDEDDGNNMEDAAELAEEEVSKQKPVPVAQLATALQGGMEAIASSLGACSAADGQLRALTSALQQQHEETRRFQEMQLQLLRELLGQRQ
ncbi:unnamed protein product [Phytophthora lilii]|uniref:Unnamed protein product n=1 Tax=Phytophthora lilii TaxID=2077276 RepID=A0A9W6XBD5_9STRA|nr:unnamed protein product [Phytophthora lilii]